VSHNLSYQKYLDKIQSGHTYILNWKYFFFPLIYSVHHKMWLATLIFFNNHLIGYELAMFYVDWNNIEGETQQHMLLFGILGGHFLNSFLFNYFYHLNINNAIAQFGSDLKKFNLAIRPVGFYRIKNFEIQCFFNTIILTISYLAFIIPTGIMFMFFLAFIQYVNTIIS